MPFEKGHQKVGGRKKGSINKATKQIAELAKKYGPESIEGLIELARTSQSDKVRCTAYNSILDRAYGRPSQSIDFMQDGDSIPLVLLAGVPNQDTQKPVLVLNGNGHKNGNGFASRN